MLTFVIYPKCTQGVLTLYSWRIKKLEKDHGLRKI